MPDIFTANNMLCLR